MKMKNILMAILLMAGLQAQAQVDPTLPVIDIQYSSTTAKVTIPTELQSVVTSNVSGANVTINSTTTDSEYCYRVKGTTTNGRLLINGNYKLTLELAECNITSKSGAAIDVECGKRVAVVLDKGTRNVLQDAANGSQKAAMYFSGHPEFQGEGSLTVKGFTKHAIAAKEYIEMKENLGSITVLGAVSDGIHCGKGKPNNDNNYFEMKGGVVTVTNAGSDCIDSDDYGCVKIKGGELNLKVTAESGAGIKCDSIFKMTDGRVNLVIEGKDAEGIRVNYAAEFKDGDIVINNAGQGSKGIKLKEDTKGLVRNGGNANFLGTDIDILLTGVNLEDGSRCMGVSVDKDMALSAGHINIQRASDEAKAYNVKGTLNVSETGRIGIMGEHYDFNPADYQYDMLLYADVQTPDPASYYANWQVGAFDASNKCCGVAEMAVVKGNKTFMTLRLYSNSATGNVTFRAFDASEKREVPLFTKQAFKSDTTTGMPSTPVLLNVGDVNGDGHIATIADLATIVKCLNKTTNKLADLNADNKVNQTDVNLMREAVLK